jgi:hypothetical protein
MDLAGEFLSVPFPIKARRLFLDERHEISGKNQLVPAGMWLVKAAKGTGKMLAVPDDVFRESYRPTDTYSENMWKETTKTVRPIWPGSGPITLS